MKKIKLENLDGNQRLLLDRALEAAKGAYAPYSHFFVGAAARTKYGEIFAGSNVENAAYPQGLCAEKSLMAILNGAGQIEDVAMIAIIAIPDDGNGCTDEPTAPCGGCRQAIFELFHLSGIDIEVIISNTNMTKIEIWKISELLPRGFGPRDLK